MVALTVSMSLSKQHTFNDVKYLVAMSNATRVPNFISPSINVTNNSLSYVSK